jgi:hypothetical protein
MMGIFVFEPGTAGHLENAEFAQPAVERRLVPKVTA